MSYLEPIGSKNFGPGIRTRTRANNFFGPEQTNFFGSGPEQLDPDPDLDPSKKLFLDPDQMYKDR